MEKFFTKNPFITAIVIFLVVLLVSKIRNSEDAFYLVAFLAAAAFANTLK